MKGIQAQQNLLMDFDNSRETPTVFFITAATYFTVSSKQIEMHAIILSTVFQHIIYLSAVFLQRLSYID